MSSTVGIQTAALFKAHQGKTFSFLGNTVTYKFNPACRECRLFEFLTTATSGTPPLHAHPWTETFYFLAGAVDFQVGDQWVQAAPGDVIHLPAGIPHTFQVKSAEARFLIWVSNAAAEQYIEELAMVAQSGIFTPKDLIAIAQNHHIQFSER